MNISNTIKIAVAAIAGFLLGCVFGLLYLPQSLWLAAFWCAFLTSSGAVLSLVLSRRKRKTFAPKPDVRAAHIVPPEVDSIFLFNTLHNISALTGLSPEKASRTIEQLATLIRAVSELHKSETTLLNEEIKIAELYLQIEQARFSKRLKIGKSVDATCLEQQVPCFIILPLVENCIRHGVEVFDGNVEVFITVDRSDKFVIIEVSDTGEGVESESLEELSGENRGLYNVRKKLQTYFGPKSDLTVQKLAPSGTRVSLYIPVEKNSQ